MRDESTIKLAVSTQQLPPPVLSSSALSSPTTTATKPSVVRIDDFLSAFMVLPPPLSNSPVVIKKLLDDCPPPPPPIHTPRSVTPLADMVVPAEQPVDFGRLKLQSPAASKNIVSDVVSALSSQSPERRSTPAVSSAATNVLKASDDSKAKTEPASSFPNIVPYNFSVSVYLFQADGTFKSVEINEKSTMQDIVERILGTVGITDSKDSWGLVLVDDDGTETVQNSMDSCERLHYTPNKLVLKRTKPRKFAVCVSSEDGESFDIEVDVFTTVKSSIQKLFQNHDSLLDGRPDEWTIWQLPLDGVTPRYLDALETPYSPLPSNVRFIIKRLNGSNDSSDSSENLTLINVQIYGDYRRAVMAPKDGLTATGIVDAVLKSLKVTFNMSTDFSLWSDCGDSKSKGRVLAPTDSVHDSWRFSLKTNKGDDFNLDLLDAVLYEIVDRKCNSNESLHQATKPATTASSKAVDEQITEKTVQVAALLGIKNQNQVMDLKSQISLLYDKNSAILSKSLSNDSISNATDDETSAKEPKRLAKLTAMLGIANEDEFAHFLSSGIRQKDAGQDKSTQKLAKILGINNNTNSNGGNLINNQSVNQSLRNQKPNTNIATLPSNRNRLEHAAAIEAYNALRKNLKKEPSANTKADSFDDQDSITDKAPRRPKVSHGLFTAKIYLVNQTYKSLKVPMDTSAHQVVSMLIERMNIKSDPEKYAIFECGHRSADRMLFQDERLFDLMCQWEEEELFVFKKKPQFAVTSNRRASQDSVSSERDRTMMDARRVAKIANIFGVSDRKTTIGGNANPEIRQILGILNSMRKSGSASMEGVKQENVLEDRIFKEGWLQRENSTPNATRYWCYIENGTFHAIFKGSDDGASDVNSSFSALSTTSSRTHLVVPIDQFKIERSAQIRNGFELIKKADHSINFVFSSNSNQLTESWITALQSNHKAMLSERTASSIIATDTSDNVAAISMNDFEIIKVLGRGNFGKVMLCRQESTGNVFAVKVIKKSSIHDERQAANTRSETRILRAIRHPFIVSLHYAFQTPTRLHLVLEYVNGGELFFHVNNFGRFSEERVRFYSAEILMALQCLHGKGIIYRDLKLENILLDKEGHVKITDFGLSRHEDEEEDETRIAGTFEYLAPEVVRGRVHGYPADWWAFGLVTFEMLCGYHPFYCGSTREELLHRILNLQVQYPSYASREAMDLLQHLMVRDPEKRLGTRGGQEIQNHAFYKSIDFNKLFEKQIEPPFKPEVTDDFDVRFFDDDFTKQPATLTPTSTTSMLDLGPNAFSEFTVSGAGDDKKANQ